MAASPPSPANFKNPRNSVTFNLNAARDGSLKDLKDLAKYVAAIPVDMLPDAFEALLLYIDARRASRILCPQEDIPRYRRVAMEGMISLVNLDVFRRNRYYSLNLTRSWYGILDTLIALHADAQRTDAQRTKNEEDMVFLVSLMSAVLTNLSRVDRETTIVLLSDEKSQVFIYKLWLRKWKNLEARFQCTSLLPICFGWKGAMDCVAKAAGGPTPVETVASTALRRLNVVMHGDLPKEMFEKLRFCCSAVLDGLLKDKDHPIARAVVDYGGVRASMRVLRSVMADAPMTDNSILCATSCFTFLHQAFDVRPGTMCVALRKGFLKGLFYFGPQLDRSNDTQAKGLKALQDILERCMPRDLVYIKVIRTMAMLMRKTSLDERRKVRESTLGAEWRKAEMILIERLAAYRMRKIATCDACGKRRFRTAFRMCGGCRDAFYCSSDCQRQGWEGHRNICIEASLKFKVKLSANIARDLATRDAQRYFLTAVPACLGKLDNFDPRTHIIQLDYSKYPPKLTIFAIDEFTLVHRSDKFLEDIQKQWERAALEADARKISESRKGEKDEPRTVPCVVITGRALRATLQSIRISLEALLSRDGLDEPPEDRRRTLPRAEVQVMARRGSYMTMKPRSVKSKTDSLDDVLAACGSTLDEFWRTNLDKIVLTTLISG